MRKPTAESSRKLRAEVDTLAFLATASRVPVPRVLAMDNPTDGSSATLVLLEFLAGNTALDETRAYKREDWGLVPRQYRKAFYRSLAATHVGFSHRVNGSDCLSD
jgi:aminoglycoside phosphotransferase (APT) family kinase protein